MLVRKTLTILALLACSSLLVACGGDDGDDGGGMSILGDCPAGADTSTGETVFTNNCSVCHAGFVQASGRGTAPVGINCGSLDTVGECMYDRAMQMSMPPDPNTKLTAAEAESLRVWLACTQP
ncbi:hypothetical protein [Haliangium sp.]|uniref:hypothetical protein n=1 Tax=Haliangium sp. TaxID=2663208 RepID=UPI003D13B480